MTDIILGALTPVPDTAPHWGRVSLAKADFDRLEALAARALPAPRRYTGGPLEDGLYLWREDHWDAGWWDSEYVSGGRGQPWWARRGSAPEEPIWLIGPIPTPDLPEEEAANG